MNCRVQTILVSITGLTVLKLYYSRQRGMLPKSYVAYLAFGAIIIIVLVSVVLRTISYWIAFSVLHGLGTIYLGLQILFVGRPEIQPGTRLVEDRTVQFN